MQPARHATGIVHAGEMQACDTGGYAVSGGGFTVLISFFRVMFCAVSRCQYVCASLCWQRKVPKLRGEARGDHPFWGDVCVGVGPAECGESRIAGSCAVHGVITWEKA